MGRYQLYVAYNNNNNNFFSLRREKMQFFKKITKKIHQKLLEYPAYVKLVQSTKANADRFIGLFWLDCSCVDFSVHKKKTDIENETNNGIM